MEEAVTMEEDPTTTDITTVPARCRCTYARLGAVLVPEILEKYPEAVLDDGGVRLPDGTRIIIEPAAVARVLGSQCLGRPLDREICRLVQVGVTSDNFPGASATLAVEAGLDGYRLSIETISPSTDADWFDFVVGVAGRFGRDPSIGVLVKCPDYSVYADEDEDPLSTELSFNLPDTTDRIPALVDFVERLFAEESDSDLLALLRENRNAYTHEAVETLRNWSGGLEVLLRRIVENESFRRAVLESTDAPSLDFLRFLLTGEIPEDPWRVACHLAVDIDGVFTIPELRELYLGDRRDAILRLVWEYADWFGFSPSFHAINPFGLDERARARLWIEAVRREGHVLVCSPSDLTDILLDSEIPALIEEGHDGALLALTALRYILPVPASAHDRVADLFARICDRIDYVPLWGRFESDGPGTIFRTNFTELARFCDTIGKTPPRAARWLEINAARAAADFLRGIYRANEALSPYDAEVLLRSLGAVGRRFADDVAEAFIHVAHRHGVVRYIFDAADDGGNPTRDLLRRLLREDTDWQRKAVTEIRQYCYHAVVERREIHGSISVADVAAQVVFGMGGWPFQRLAVLQRIELADRDEWRRFVGIVETDPTLRRSVREVVRGLPYEHVSPVLVRIAELAELPAGEVIERLIRAASQEEEQT